MCPFNNGELLLLLLLQSQTCLCTPSSRAAVHMARIHAVDELRTHSNHTPPLNNAGNAEATLKHHQALADRRSTDVALRPAPVPAPLSVSPPAASGRALTAHGLTIVTAADHTHKCPLQNLVRSVRKFNPGMRVLVYDIGVPVRGAHPDLDLGSLSRAAGAGGSSGVVLRRFPYANYPRFFLVNESRGEYAWKPAIIKLAAEEFGQVLWLDAGDEVRRELSQAAKLIREVGFFSPATFGSFSQWTHQGMRAHFNISASGHNQKKMCSGAIVGMSRDSDAYRKVLIPWHACAMNRSCIAPPGSSRSNHRQDQAALTCIIHLSQQFSCQGMCGIHKTCRYGLQVHRDGKHKKCQR